MPAMLPDVDPTFWGKQQGKDTWGGKPQVPSQWVLGLYNGVLGKGYQEHPLKGPPGPPEAVKPSLGPLYISSLYPGL